MKREACHKSDLTQGGQVGSLLTRPVIGGVMRSLSKILGVFTAFLSAKSTVPVVRASDFYSALEKGKSARPQFRGAAESHLAKLRASSF